MFFLHLTSFPPEIILFMATTKEELGLLVYEGIPNGLSRESLTSIQYDEERKDFATLNLSGPYIDFVGDLDNSTMMYYPIMLYSEVMFLKAEAALRGWTSGDANTFFKEGMQSSMDYVGVDATEAQTFIDGVTDLTGSNEAQLKSIITQKWIANFPNGIEAWADFRRTDYPDLTLPADGVSGNATVSANTYIKRVRYPDNQHDYNPLLQQSYEDDRMDIRMWWDVADTKSKSGGLMSSNF